MGILLSRQVIDIVCPVSSLGSVNGIAWLGAVALQVRSPALTVDARDDTYITHYHNT
jgi:hypothetical protein